MFNKNSLSERDICTKFITPVLESAGWDRLTQILEEVSFTDGRIYVRGKLTARGKRKRVDYILYYNSNPLAIIEAKDNNHSVNAGILFSSNGDGFLFHDHTASDDSIEMELSLENFPSPQVLWDRLIDSFIKAS